MPVRGQAPDDDLAALYRDGDAWPGEADWFGAHTYIGDSDPDGVRSTRRCWPSPTRCSRAQAHAARAPAEPLAPVPGALVAQALAGTPESGSPSLPA